MPCAIEARGPRNGLDDPAWGRCYASKTPGKLSKTAR